MCGRYTHRYTWAEIVQYCRLMDGGTPPNLQPRYNMAPTQDAPIIRRREDGERELAMLRWGLIPFWADPSKKAFNTINARAAARGPWRTDGA